MILQVNQTRIIADVKNKKCLAGLKGIPPTGFGCAVDLTVACPWRITVIIVAWKCYSVCRSLCFIIIHR